MKTYRKIATVKAKIFKQGDEELAQPLRILKYVYTINYEQILFQFR